MGPIWFGGFGGLVLSFFLFFPPPSGMDADLTVFDPAKIADKATFAEPAQKSFGIYHVIVNGTFVVKQSVFLDDVHPGQPVRGDGGVARATGTPAGKRAKMN